MQQLTALKPPLAGTISIRFPLRLGLLFFLAMMWGLVAGTATAHPLGNNTLNRQARIQISAARLELSYLLDVAEIPTLLEIQKARHGLEGTPSQQEWAAYTAQWAQRLVADLHVELDGRPVALQVQDHAWVLQPGAAGLSVLRLKANYTSPLSAHSASVSLRYRDDYRPSLSGWKEVWIAAANGVAVTRSTAGRSDRSHGLTEYDGLATPPNELIADATLVFAEPASRVSDRVLQETPTPAIAPPMQQPSDVTSSSPLEQSAAFFKLGVHHIATGWDHLVFLLGLLLLGKSLPQLAKIITGFTIAHSVTLALAANHWVTPPGAWVEPGIALTIAYVGMVNLAWRQSRHGVWLALGFGLVHGFGFAGALAQTLATQGTTGNHWLVSLLSFNLGIEAFQLALICVVVPLLRLAELHAWYGKARQAASVAVLGAGLIWLLLRVSENLVVAR